MIFMLKIYINLIYIKKINILIQITLYIRLNLNNHKTYMTKNTINQKHLGKYN